MKQDEDTKLVALEEVKEMVEKPFDVKKVEIMK
jgi:hypothetical protein